MDSRERASAHSGRERPLAFARYRQSANGAFVNGSRIFTECVLDDGAVIRLGETLLVCQMHEANRWPDREIQCIGRTNLTVLLLGETGVGKDYAAGLIDATSGRRGPFVAVNCGSLPRELVATELFGHVEGAFSGAKTRRDGLFAAAHGGTLFLDEIGDLPADAQPVLLRALEERKVRPVGSVRELPVDVRFIAATHVDLDGAVAQGRFRPDLLARLNSGARLCIPPLRARRAEIPALIDSLAGSLGIDVNVTDDVDALEAMLVWPWPDNVRELRRAVELFARLGDRETLDLDFVRRNVTNNRAKDEDAASPRPSHITLVPRLLATIPPAATSGAIPARPLRKANPNLNPMRIRKALEASAGNVTAAAEALETARQHLYRCFRRYEIDVKEFRRNG